MLSLGDPGYRGTYFLHMGKDAPVTTGVVEVTPPDGYMVTMVVMVAVALLVVVVMMVIVVAPDGVCDDACGDDGVTC